MKASTFRVKPEVDQVQKIVDISGNVATGEYGVDERGSGTSESFPFFSLALSIPLLGNSSLLGTQETLVV